ncbi:MAG: glycosyltransferase family 4 protein [Planctomycetaceae bacterium]|nr:glycosyltransferase family 4 protein [Planctomycetaceae bacterium]
MRILMSTDTVGGVWTYSIELSAQFAARGHEVVLAAMGPPPTAAQESAAAIKGVRLRCRQFKLEWMDDPWDDVERCGQWLLGVAAQTAPDVVHLNHYCNTSLPWQRPVVVVGHSCVLSWWQAVKGQPAPARWRDYAEKVRQGVQAADVLVAPTLTMLSQLRRHYGPLPPARVIYNGLAADGAVAGDAGKELLALSAGRLWDEAKNAAALAKAASMLTWPVYLAGAVDHPAATRDGRVDGVRCLGPLDRTDLLSWMARAAVYVLPARYEPFGLTALEAAMRGCALILGDIRSLREVWGQSAIFVPPADDTALAYAIDRVLGEEPLRVTLSRLARARARRFTAVRMALSYLALYRRLLQGRLVCVPSHQEHSCVL